MHLPWSKQIKMGFFEFAKVLMVVYNLLILVGGGGLIAVGFWLRLTGDVLGSNALGVFSINAINTIKVDIYFIVVGIIMVLLGFLGCCGAKKESKCLLIMFFSIIVIIFISELTLGMFALAYSTHVSFALRSRPPRVLSDFSCYCLFLFASLVISAFSGLTFPTVLCPAIEDGDGLAKLIKTFLSSWGKPVLQDQYGRDFHFTSLWNMTMTKLDCCGFNNYTDFIGSYYLKHYGEIYHPSCCENTTFICNLENAQNSMIPGCFAWILRSLDERLYILGAVAAGVGGIETGAMFVSLYLFCYLDKDAS
ncbi:tetraspanin-1 [Silurus meridionalis]|uniref:tetraspanin-1 n=1 Tax=Silurus meridionalis TaxID=175797 RepID=UPI001EE9B72F|nr:tetraspanin-1 [Silurus meridionalis]